MEAGACNGGFVPLLCLVLFVTVRYAVKRNKHAAGEARGQHYAIARVYAAPAAGRLYIAVVISKGYRIALGIEKYILSFFVRSLKPEKHIVAFQVFNRYSHIAHFGIVRRPQIRPGIYAVGIGIGAVLLLY